MSHPRAAPLRHTGEILNPHHLRTLVTVVETGSFADAARQLGYTSSAVSQQISTLERSVKLTLFERSAQSIRPTEVAMLLADRAREQLSGLRQLEDELALIAHGGIGRIRIGSYPTASKRLLPHVFADLHRRNPHLELLLDEGEPDQLITLMRDGELDIALVFRYDLVPVHWPRSLRRTALFSEEIRLVVPAHHALAAADTVELRDLRDEAWITPRADTAGAICLSRACAQQGFEPKVAMRSNDYDVVSRFVRTGLGIALVPALSEVRLPELVSKPIADLTARRHAVALYRPIKYNPAIRTALTSTVTAVERLTAEGLAVTVAPRTTGAHPGRAP